MIHVPIAELKDKLSEFVAVAASGEEVVITRHGQDVARLLPLEDDARLRRKAALDGLQRIGLEVFRRHGPTSAEEIREWIDEGRRF